MISIACTKNHSILSKLIRELTGEPASHCILIIDNKMVFHTNLIGPHPEWLASFLETNEVVDHATFELSLEQEEQIWTNVIQSGRKRKYDISALFSTGLKLILKKIGIDVDVSNMQSNVKDHCVEWMKVLSPVVEVPNNLEAWTPYQLVKYFKKK